MTNFSVNLEVHSCELLLSTLDLQNFSSFWGGAHPEPSVFPVTGRHLFRGDLHWAAAKTATQWMPNTSQRWFCWEGINEQLTTAFVCVKHQCKPCRCVWLSWGWGPVLVICFSPSLAYFVYHVRFEVSVSIWCFREYEGTTWENLKIFFFPAQMFLLWCLLFFFFPRRTYCVCSDGTEIQIVCPNVLIILICSHMEENIMPTFN